jgi:hypothetical protein
MYLPAPIIISAVVAVVVAKKRASGAQRRGYARLIEKRAFFGLLRPGKPETRPLED